MKSSKKSLTPLIETVLSALQSGTLEIGEYTILVGTKVSFRRTASGFEEIKGLRVSSESRAGDVPITVPISYIRVEEEGNRYILRIGSAFFSRTIELPS